MIRRVQMDDVLIEEPLLHPATGEALLREVADQNRRLLEANRELLRVLTNCRRDGDPPGDDLTSGK